MNKVQCKVLNHLLDQYEQSKSFLGENKVSQNFSVNITKLFPKYDDDAEYDLFCEVNESLKELEHLELVTLVCKKRSNVLEKAVLNKETLNECYEQLHRVPKKSEHQWLEELWQQKERELIAGDDTLYLPLFQYFAAQREKLAKNQKVEYYRDEHRE